MTATDPDAPDMKDPVEALIEQGLAKEPVRAHRSWRDQEAVPLSRPLDELLDETRSDVRL